MTPERWRQVDDLVQAALDRKPSERPSFLERSCWGDHDLLREVEALLSFEDQAEDLLDTTVKDAALSAAEAHAEPEPDTVAGSRMGPYRILREIGRGGMGAVYLAVRDDDQFRKQVAIKKVLRGMDTDFVLTRFRHERQILAGLEHPYIARLHDGGSTEDGHPYLVMEYVDGLTLIDYATSHNLDLRSRLELFRKVCAAVQYAHQNLVVHRDLKPGNILVTEDGSPKLLDFGISKLLGPAAGGSTVPATGFMPMMTPEYASPELVRGESITTATDVYALGAILYELLTGVRAHRITGYTPMEVERVVCQEAITRPSTASAIVHRGLAGDLDNIILKALHKEPERRYTSAAEFAEDIRRHLAGLPVGARQDSFSYRLGKFVRRHKVPVLAAVLTGISLIVGATAAILQARRAERRFEQVKLLARSVLYDIHDSIRDLPGSTKSVQLVVTTALKYLDSLASDAKGDSSLQLDLVDAYQRVGDVQGHITRASLGDSAAALKSYQKALTIAQQLDESGKPDVEIKLRLMNLHFNIGNLLTRTQTRSAASVSFSRAIAVGDPIAAANPENKMALRTLASAYRDLARNQTDSAQSFVNTKKSLALVERLAAANPADRETRMELSDGYSNLGLILERREALAAARDLYQQAASIREALVKEDPANSRFQQQLMFAYAHLGDVYGNQQRPNLGDRKSAAENYGKAVAITENLMKADLSNKRARSDYAIALSRLASVHDDGLLMLRKAVSILEAVSQADKMNIRLRIMTGIGYSQIAAFLEKDGDRAGALREFRRAAALEESVVAVDAKDIGARRQLQGDQYGIARLLAISSDRRGALEALRKSVNAAEAIAAMDPANVLSLSQPPRAYGTAGGIMIALAGRASTPQQRRQDWQEAKDWYQRSVEGWQNLRHREGFTKAHEAELSRMQSEIKHCEKALSTSLRS